jgi:hypothetical protein
MLGVFSPLRTNGKEDGENEKVTRQFCSLIARTHVGLIAFHEMGEQQDPTLCIKHFVTHSSNLSGPGDECRLCRKALG